MSFEENTIAMVPLFGEQKVYPYLPNFPGRKSGTHATTLSNIYVKAMKILRYELIHPYTCIIK